MPSGRKLHSANGDRRLGASFKRPQSRNKIHFQGSLIGFPVAWLFLAACALNQIPEHVSHVARCVAVSVEAPHELRSIFLVRTWIPCQDFSRGHNTTPPYVEPQVHPKNGPDIHNIDCISYGCSRDNVLQVFYTQNQNLQKKQRVLGVLGDIVHRSHGHRIFGSAPPPATITLVTNRFSAETRLKRSL